MKKLLPLIILHILKPCLIYAQASGVYSGYFDVTITDQKVNKTLQTIEIKAWKGADSGLVSIYDNPMLDNTYNVRMTRSQCNYLFKDSFPSKSMNGSYRLNLFENRSADSIYVMSFDPFVRTKARELKGFVVDSSTTIGSDSTSGTAFSQLYGHNEYSEWHDATELLSLIPISGYSDMLNNTENELLKKTLEQELATILNGKCNGDSIFRSVRFTQDSNEYLPQAPYHDLMLAMKNEMLSGQINAYNNQMLDRKLTKFQIESSCVAWDSTNQVEDPNNPGVFIIAPIKSEGWVKTLIIYEKYVPCIYSPLIPHYYWPPVPYMSYKREVISYGLVFTNGKTLWFDPNQVDAMMIKGNFKFSTYEECFRAERFQRLKAESNLRHWN